MDKSNKKRLKRKIWINTLKRQIKYQKTAVLLLVGLLLFPIAVGLIYKIPVSFVDIEIGDLLSFYAVALGLFASFLTYRESENRKALARQEALRPKFELSIKFNDNKERLIFFIKNTTENDYIVNYIELDYSEIEDETVRRLNARNQIEFEIESWDEKYPERISVGIKDTDGHEWAVGFEHQSNSIKYCRTFTDLLT